MSLPAYQPSLDLNSAAAAREYMSRFDPNEAERLDIPFDDVDTVKANIQVYAAELYDALLHPYDAEADCDDRKAKYLDQQEAAMTGLQKLLSSPTQLKAAKACSILLIDAAIAIHTTGVSSERYRKHDAAARRDLKVDDAYKISTSLICSTRVEAMIDAVKANKLVAKDVLEQKNFLRFAECPEAYLARKFAHLRSNKTRQDKVEMRAAEEEAKGTGARRGGRGVKRARYAEEDDDEFVL